MSLATYAAPFNEDNNINSNTKFKHTPKTNSSRVTKLLSKIHESFENDDSLADFTPPPMPKSSGVQKTVEKENFESRTLPEYTQFYNTKVESHQPYIVDHDTSLNHYYNENQSNKKSSNSDDINNKLNDIIQMLKEQQDYKTEHVTEEIILYSFFGIFIIYLVDSFKRVGKYTR
jgi:hypothetical protein